MIILKVQIQMLKSLKAFNLINYLPADITD